MREGPAEPITGLSSRRQRDHAVNGRSERPDWSEAAAPNSLRAVSAVRGTAHVCLKAASRTRPQWTQRLAGVVRKAARMPEIRHVAAPRGEPDLFVAGEFERTAHVWCLSRATEVASVDTVFDFGGRRLALVTGDAPVIVAGAWARHGVCGYSLTGEQLWQNKARSAIQHVTALRLGPRRRRLREGGRPRSSTP